MSKTALVFSPIYYRHDPGRNHPESAQRLRAIVNQLKRSKALQTRNLRVVTPGKATIESVETVHCPEYIRLVEAVCKSGGGLLDLQDTVVSPESYEVALYAAGGALKAIDLVMDGLFDNAFALVRPPGHHASKFRACGFCIFNNVAIAAEHLIRKFKMKRVLILDVDAHHGNGTQEVFYKTDKVLYMSLHEDPSSFPGTGFIDEMGEGEGLGYKVNIPLPYGTGDQMYLKAMDEIVEPIVRQYKPEFVLVSAGFDSHYADPVGNLSLSAFGIQHVYRKIEDLASDLCHGRLALILEGGYNPASIGKLVAATIPSASRNQCITRERTPTIGRHESLQGAKTVKAAKEAQRGFWKID